MNDLHQYDGQDRLAAWKLKDVGIKLNTVISMLHNVSPNVASVCLYGLKCVCMSFVHTAWSTAC